MSLADKWDAQLHTFEGDLDLTLGRALHRVTSS